MAGPNLLNDDGSASMATALLMSHHAFRRDLERFAGALVKVGSADVSRSDALKEEWAFFRGALHGHHEMEDKNIFPNLESERPALAATIARLSADHRHIDPLLEHGDSAFAALPESRAASAVVAELRTLLEPHLALEEAEVVPFLRPAKEFPPMPNEEMAELYAKGFAWASHGVASEVLQALDRMLPAALVAKLPEARAAFHARCLNAWGFVTTTASRTSIPGD